MCVWSTGLGEPARAQLVGAFYLCRAWALVWWGWTVKTASLPSHYKTVVRSCQEVSPTYTGQGNIARVTLTEKLGLSCVSGPNEFSSLVARLIHSPKSPNINGLWEMGLWNLFLFVWCIRIFIFGFYMYSARWFQMLVPHILHVMMWKLNIYCLDMLTTVSILGKVQSLLAK